MQSKPALIDLGAIDSAATFSISSVKPKPRKVLAVLPLLFKATQNMIALDKLSSSEVQAILESRNQLPQAS